MPSAGPEPAPVQSDRDRHAARLPQLEHSALAELRRRGADVDAIRTRTFHIDPVGWAHVRLSPSKDGARIVGGEVLSHVAPDGTIETKGPALVPRLEGAWRLDIADAERIATDALRSLGTPRTQIRERVYWPTVAAHRAAFRIVAVVRGPTVGLTERALVVDAGTGELLDARETSAHVEGIGDSYYSSTVAFQTVDSGGSYRLKDVQCSSLGCITTSWLDKQGNPSQDEFGFGYEDADNLWGDSSVLRAGGNPMSATGQTAAVDAHYGMTGTYTFMRQVLGRDGPFGDGAGFTAVVHFDGPGSTFIGTNRAAYFVGANSQCAEDTDLDVVGHELSHAVEYAELAGITYSIGERGGFSEANSDILGHASAMYIKATAAGLSGLPDHFSDWTFNPTRCGRALRYFFRPSRDGSSYDAWHVDIERLGVDGHDAAGPLNRMFYFLAEGAMSATGTQLPNPDYSSTFLPQGMSGLGVRDAITIWYRAVADRLMEPPTYAEMRAAMIEASTGLWSKYAVETRAVEDAFAAINVGPASERVNPVITATATQINDQLHLIVDVVDADTPLALFLQVEIGNQVLIGPDFAVDDSRLTIINPQHFRFAFMLDANQFGHGDHMLLVYAEDMRENLGSLTQTVTVDFVGPVITGFTQNPPNGTTTRTFVLAAKDVDGGLQRANVMWPGQNVPEVHTLSGISASKTLTRNFANTPHGNHFVTVEVRDVYNNTTTGVFPIFVDRTPPICIVGAGAVGSTTASITGSATDADSDMWRMQLSLDGSVVKDDTGHPFPTPSQYRLGWSGAASSGTHTARAECWDATGNYAFADRTFRISAPPQPFVSILDKTTTSVTVRFGGDDDFGVISASVWASCNGGSWFTTADSYLYPPSPATHFEGIATFDLSNWPPATQCRVKAEVRDEDHLDPEDVEKNFSIPASSTPSGVGTCGQTYVAGGNAPETRVIETGSGSGTLAFGRNTYVVPDRMTLTCRDGGTINGGASWATSCVGTQGWTSSNLTINCATRYVRVSVNPNCAGTPDTAWEFQVGCAN